MTRPYTDDAIRLLGGAVRIRKRPSGPIRDFVSICPISSCEYEDHLPLTIRQIFYRLVGAYN